MAGDVLSLESEDRPGAALIRPVMRAGRRVQPRPSLDECRAHAARELKRLPETLRALRPDAPYPVEVADALVRLAADVDRRQAGH